jgi:hypothetical protein
MKNLFILLAFCAGLATLNPTNLIAQTGKKEALESLGAISGIMLYNTYVSIGAMADGFATETYDAETIKSLMDEQQSSMASAVETFDKLLASGFVTEAADKKYVEDAKEICGLLKSMAGNLSDYSTDKSTEHSDAFQETRKEAWSKIAALLGFEE